MIPRKHRKQMLIGKDINAQHRRGIERSIKRHNTDWIDFTDKIGGYEECALELVVQPDAVMHLFGELLVGNHNDITLAGPPGTGKTFAAIALARESLFVNGATVNFVRSVDLDRTDEEELTTPRVLVIDDLGLERETPTRHELLNRVFDTRWRTRRRNIVTTNLDGPQFEEHVGARIIDRISGPFVTLTGTSRRKHDPELDPENYAQFDQYLAEFPTGGEQDAAECIRGLISHRPHLWPCFANQLILAGAYEAIVDTSLPHWQYGVLDNVAQHLFTPEQVERIRNLDIDAIRNNAAHDYFDEF